MFGFLSIKDYIYGAVIVAIIAFVWNSIDNVCYKPLRECKSSFAIDKESKDFALKVAGDKLSECLIYTQEQEDLHNKNMLEELFGVLDMNETGEELEKDTTFNLYHYSF